MTSTVTYRVTGMTCGHCVAAVREEVSALAGVVEVDVDLEAGGVSKVHVRMTAPVSDAEVAGALDEAGDYQLAPPEVARS